ICSISIRGSKNPSFYCILVCWVYCNKNLNLLPKKMLLSLFSNFVHFSHLFFIFLLKILSYVLVPFVIQFTIFDRFTSFSLSNTYLHYTQLILTSILIWLFIF